ncbi:MAG: twin-arginine translocation signal domain-containing protein [Ardenticatenaceae bacterium]|nr:twin-arginine translocation signal domain-containing protein [Ardenticatenaceae bacterium]
MSAKQTEELVNRRKFLKAAAVTAVAATATGAGASLLNSQKSAQLPGQSLTATIQKNGSNEELITQLTALQAENARLQADLELANYRLSAQETAVTETDTAAQTMSIELEAANQQIGILAGLVALYEQLDDADVMSLFEEGLTAVSTAITDAVDELPSLSEGIALGRQILTELDDQIPLLANGRSWLETQTDKMYRYYTAVEVLLETAVEQVGPFLQMFNEWVQKILKWLPFNLGERTSTIMDALTTLLLETPTTLTGLYTNVTEPLAAWVGGPDTEVPLRQKLIQPMREQMLSQADTVVAKTVQVKVVYEENMVRQVETAVIARRQIQNLIQSYRQQHQI